MTLWTIPEDQREEIEFQNGLVLELLKKHNLPVELWNVYSVKLLSYLKDLLPLSYIIHEDKEMALCASHVLDGLKDFFKDFYISHSESENNRIING